MPPPARMSRRTNSCARDATSSGSHPASTEPPCPRWTTVEQDDPCSHEFQYSACPEKQRFAQSTEGFLPKAERGSLLKLPEMRDVPLPLPGNDRPHLDRGGYVADS